MSSTPKRIPRGAIAGALVMIGCVTWLGVESLELSGGLLGSTKEAVKPSEVGDHAAKMFSLLAAEKPEVKQTKNDHMVSAPLSPQPLVRTSSQTFFNASPDYVKELEAIRLQGLRRFHTRLEEGTAVKASNDDTREGRPSGQSRGKNVQDDSLLEEGEERAADRWLHKEKATARRGSTTLMAGYSIPVQLQTRLVTGVPSMVRGTVLRSHYGREGDLVIPAGTQVLGEFNNNVEYGNTRVAINWTRLVFPDNSSIDLGSPGFRSAHDDGSGGAPGNVDNHWGNVLLATSISTILSVGVPFTQSTEDRWGRAPYRQRLAERASERLSDVGEEIVDRELRRSPVISVERGQVLLVTVEKDLELPARSRPTGGRR